MISKQILAFPQGDCLSPVFFIAYLTEALESNYRTNNMDELRNEVNHPVIIKNLQMILVG